MLLKGEYEWFSIEDVMDEKIATIFSDISETKDLPSIPSSVMKLQHLLSNKKTSAKDIECELKNLPAIAMRTIAIANNLKISSSQKITSLQHAISFLGFETISELLLIASLRSFIFKTKKFTDTFFWDNAIMTGKIAEFLIKQFAPYLNNDEAYIAASLCNMGKVVSAICLPDITDKIHSDIYNTKSSSYVETEKKHDATSHVILGELAGAMWGLPDYVLYTTAYHHTPASDVKSSIDTTGVDFIDFAETEIPKNPQNKATLQQIVALSISLYI